MEDFVLDLEVCTEPETESSGWSVVGRIISEKSLNQDIMQKALHENPWSVMGYCLNLKFWPPEQAMREVDLNSVPFWIQIHSLPREMMDAGSIEVEGTEHVLSSNMRNFPKGRCHRKQKIGPIMRAPPAKQLLSPGKQRSFSWDGERNRADGDWRSQKAARELTFDGARELGSNQSRAKDALGLNSVLACENIGDVAPRSRWPDQTENYIVFEVLERPISFLVGFNQPGGPSEAIIEYPDESGVPELDNVEYANEPSVPELVNIEYATEFEPGVPEIAEQELKVPSLMGIASPKKVLSLSPAKMIRTVMNLSNAFRSMNLKRNAEVDGDWKVSKKKQKVVETLNQRIEDVMCIELGSCLPQAKRKYKKRVSTSRRRKTTQTSVVIEEVEVLHDVPIAQTKIGWQKKSSQEYC
ncbi:hypothetical protein COLO4_08890 [Corchorus olitorius]|uniref:DUF4283 domain-containing protein n=1 Tax=Corchorus olitorius TaxID=93759 RepID=A0A1R3KE74_9ROSI|nr:hypothetical protein COLO4_08890 [Corchorus olitorius]